MILKISGVVKLRNDQLLATPKNFLFHKRKFETKIELERLRTGSREIVGFGWNGEPAYLDRFDHPFPSIRFRPCTPEIMALREKERGDWRKLTCNEKKSLYRASFAQTFAEMSAPTGELKLVIGQTLIFISLAIWLSLYVRFFVMSKVPESLSRESRIEQYYRLVGMNANPFSGGPYRPPGAEYREFKWNPLNKIHNEYTNPSESENEESEGPECSS